MVNLGEPLINVVMTHKPNALTGLNQKLRSQEQQLPLLLSQTRRLPADRRDLTHLVVHVQNVATPSISRTGTPAARRVNGWAGTGRWNKRMPVVTDGIGVARNATSPRAKAC
jgi:hypothetical protein